MYPRISDLINDILGTEIILPVQTYGFFVALAFLFGGLIVYLDLRRKEREKIIFPVEKVRIKGKPASTTELIITALISFAAGFKISGAIIDYKIFAQNPQQYVFSSDGNWWGGIILATAITFFTYYEKRRKKTVDSNCR